MYCNACGCELSEHARFCQRCGRPTPITADTTHRRPLERPREGRRIAGVCAAIARYFDVDPILIRLLVIVMVFAGLSGVLFYIVGWIIIPEEPVPLRLDAPATTPAHPQS